MPDYVVTLRDANGQPEEADDEIVMSLQENWRAHGLGGRIRSDANGLRLQYDGDPAALVNAGVANVVAAGEPGHVDGNVTYKMSGLGEDPDGGVYDAYVSVPAAGGRKRRRKTRKPKRKSRLTRRR